MPSRKTVLIYRNALLPISETFIREQATALRDWRPVLVGRRLLQQLPLDGVDVRILGPQHPTFGSRLLWRASDLIRITPPHIKRMLKAEEPSLIHAHFGPDALNAWPLARALKLPMLVTLHGYDINTHREWWEAGHAGLRMRRYPQRLLQLAQQPRVGFIAVSEAIRGRAIDYGIAPERIAVNYIGIDTRQFSPGSIPIEQRPPHVLFIGRLVEKKGCRYVIEAMSIAQKEVPMARLIVIGDGPLREDLEQFARALGVPVDFRGALGAPDVKRALAQARLLCLPSITAKNGDAEGFGLVLLEAQASGVPVVTSARGGAVEGILEGVTGYSFAEGDSRSLAARLVSLLNDDAALREMADQGSRFVTGKYALIDCVRRLEALYDAAAGSLTAVHSAPA